MQVDNNDATFSNASETADQQQEEHNNNTEIEHNSEEEEEEDDVDDEEENNNNDDDDEEEGEEEEEEEEEDDSDQEFTPDDEIERKQRAKIEEMRKEQLKRLQKLKSDQTSGGKMGDRFKYLLEQTEVFTHFMAYGGGMNTVSKNKRGGAQHRKGMLEKDEDEELLRETAADSQKNSDCNCFAFIY